MDDGTVPPTTDQTEERADDRERGCRGPSTNEETTPAAPGVDTADHIGVRSWVTTLFSR